jgi:hypothetical protein
MSFVTEKQLGLLHHTLGVTPEKRIPFRNHFVAGEGHHDQADLKALEATGFMSRRDNAEWMGGGDLFRATEAGKSYALDNLSAAPPPERKSLFREFMDNDCGYSFSEFLCGGRMPKYETRGSYPGEYRMWRWNYSYPGDSSQVHGEWRATKKGAKATYKVALKVYQQQRKQWRTA